MARKVIDTLENKKGEDILLMDIHEVASFADYFVLASGTSDRMIHSLGEAVQEMSKEYVGRTPALEGDPRQGWLVVDLGDIVVHLFSPDRRDYYRLEQLWERGKVLVRLK